MTDLVVPAQSTTYDPRLLEVMRAASEDTAEWAADHARDEVDAFLGVAFTHGVNSPIERLFLAAFAPYAIVAPGYSIRPQVRIGKYTADFVVTFAVSPGDLVAQVVVECDGHDYHERTKEQAEHDRKRDRYMAAEGYHVMRFTGRELWRDPSACVEEVIDFTQGKPFDDYNALIVARAQGNN